jgi:rubredoxin
VITHTCPHCGVSLDGELIPGEYYVTVGKPDAPQRFIREIGVEVRGVYDGILYWQCPDCGGNWPRFAEGHPRHAIALELIAKGKKVSQ